MAQMAGAVEARVSDGIAWLGVPEGGTGLRDSARRAELLSALIRAEADTSVACIVLLGLGLDNCAGDDPQAVDAFLETPGLADLCLRIERCTKPVVAGLQGWVLGSRAELALAAHYRVAMPAARFGLPNVLYGLPPVAGASQRLPRLVGAAPALDLLLSGRAISIDTTAPEGLVDRLADGPLDEELRAFCAELRAEGLGPRPASQRRDGFVDPQGYQRAVAARRTEVAASANPASREIVAAVEAAQLLPFAGGLEFEADAYETCRDSDVAAALRAAASAERAVAAGMSPARPGPRHVAVLGEGPLAVPLLLALLPVADAVDWGSDAPEALHAGVIALHNRLEAARHGGELSAEDAELRLSRLRVGPAAEMAGEAEMILIAGPGQREVAAAPGACRLLAYPARVEEVGLRFAPSPASARLVEVICGPRASAAQIAGAEALAARMGCLAIRVTSPGESLGGRIFDACCRAADALVDMGQSPFAIDAACRDWGWRRGPFLRRDQMGLQRFGAQTRAEGAANWATELAGAGRRGRDEGRGFYDWPASGGPMASAEVEALLDSRRPAAEALSAQSLQRLLIGAMANEGARMLEAGMLARAGDLDLVAFQVLGMPRWRGGPMHAALHFGARAVRDALSAVSHSDHAFWVPHPLWDRLDATKATRWPEG